MSQPISPAPQAESAQASARAESCGGCYFYDAVGKYSPVARGTCRRYPPAAAKAPSDWCGEFKAAPQPKKGA